MSCYTIVIAKLDATLDESSVDDVCQCEENIVSKFRELLSVGDDVQRRGRVVYVNYLLRTHDLDVRLTLVERDNSIALYIACMTLSVVTSLRQQWASGQLRRTLESVFTFLSGARQVRIKKLTWLLNDYERTLEFFSSVQGISFIHCSVIFFSG